MRILITISLWTIWLTTIAQTSIDTESKYPRSDVKGVIIQNSLPKGGLQYTDQNGKVYVYTIFWTRIINETDKSFTITIDFPEDSFELASSAGRYFKLLLPNDTMALEKEKLFNYGLTNLESFLNKNLGKKSTLKRTINPKQSNAFYIVTLFNRGVDGTLRTGLTIKGENCFYRINDKEVHCGKINFKKL
ncbi:MAG: hypothetical protein ORN85_00010 [Sediminibacterium sp.]|nr:hypothetical protein [Sediminibacterium sp.]